MKTNTRQTNEQNKQDKWINNFHTKWGDDPEYAMEASAIVEEYKIWSQLLTEANNPATEQALQQEGTEQGFTP